MRSPSIGSRVGQGQKVAVAIAAVAVAAGVGVGAQLVGDDEAPRMLEEGETLSRIGVGERVVLPFTLAAQEYARAQVGLAPGGDGDGVLDDAVLSLSFVRADAPDVICTSNREEAAKPEGVRQALATHRARTDEDDPCRQPGPHAFVIELDGPQQGEDVELQVIASVIGRAPDLSGDVPVEERDRTGGGLGTLGVMFGGLLGAGLLVRRRRVSSAGRDVPGLEDVGDLPPG